ncbi:MAG TPA: hypothetical protein VFY92_04150, partial [Hyphomicrobiaceae bacterium]|nr:hypothetical protein [Hyphomicrobiaceae bacterium]
MDTRNNARLTPKGREDTVRSLWSTTGGAKPPPPVAGGTGDLENRVQVHWGRDQLAPPHIMEGVAASAIERGGRR